MPIDNILKAMEKLENRFKRKDKFLKIVIFSDWSGHIEMGDRTIFSFLSQEEVMNWADGVINNVN